MFPIQKIMKEWLSNKCENDEQVELKLRRLIIQDKQLLRKINDQIQKGTKPLTQGFIVREIQDLIEGFMESRKLYIYPCKLCGKKEIFNTHKVDYHLCKN